MIFGIQGKNYNFELISQNRGQNFYFFIRAICRFTGRTSCINNLNTILSEFNVGMEDPKVEDSIWIITKEDVIYFEEIAKQFLSELSFVNYLEKKLDEDRKLGEWENFISI